MIFLGFPQRLTSHGRIGSRIAREIVRNKDKFDRIAIFTSKGTSESKASELDNLKKEGVDIIIGDVTNGDDVKKAYDGKINHGSPITDLTEIPRHRHGHLSCRPQRYRKPG